MLLKETFLKEICASMKFWLEDIIWMFTSLLQSRARPPELAVVGDTRKYDSNIRASTSFRTVSSAFLVFDRKMMSREHFALSSLSLWTVWGFPIPQQFQLRTTKEEGDEGCENPAASHRFALSFGLQSL